MKQFTIYKHPIKDKYKAVKVGFSWPGLIFNGGWMLFKGLIFRSILFIILTNALIFHNLILSGNRYEELMTPIVGDWIVINAIFLWIVSLVIFFLPGFKGNAWLHKKYLKNGYVIVETVSVDSKKSAIALAKNLKKEDKEEEYQEMISGNKECPMCAETVKARAKICRFCNYEFE